MFNYMMISIQRNLFLLKFCILYICVNNFVVVKHLLLVLKDVICFNYYKDLHFWEAILIL